MTKLLFAAEQRQAAVCACWSIHPSVKQNITKLSVNPSVGTSHHMHLTVNKNAPWNAHFQGFTSCFPLS